MRGRVIAGVIVATAILLTYGVGFAAGRTGPATPGRGQQWTWEDMDRMHEQMQGWMQQHMGQDAAEQCDQMHDQMQGMMNGSGGPGGMMNGYGPGSGGPGGMMGGSGGMMG